MTASPSPLIFDRKLVRRHLQRATPHVLDHSALIDEVALEIEERLKDVKRDFSHILDLSPFPFKADKIKNAHLVSMRDVLCDEEFLPFAPESFDLIISHLALHWVNDVPGALIQMHSILKSEGLFIGSLIGEQSLRELRSCFVDAELSVMGGISPRLSPTIDLQTANTLMQRAGFQLPVVDKETVTLLYPDLFALMRDLRGMGQTNAHLERLRHPTRRKVFLEVAKLYQERFAQGGQIPATFDIIYLHGWK